MGPRDHLRQLATDIVSLLRVLPHLHPIRDRPPATLLGLLPALLAPEDLEDLEDLAPTARSRATRDLPRNNLPTSLRIVGCRMDSLMDMVGRHSLLGAIRPRPTDNRRHRRGGIRAG